MTKDFVEHGRVTTAGAEHLLDILSGKAPAEPAREQSAATAGPTIIIDTREQTPWSFGDVPTVRKKLDAGDYSIAGLEHDVAIERKTTQDLIGTLTFGRQRFERELDWLCSYKRALIIVEGDVDDIIEGRYRSQVTPQALVGSFASFWARWGVATAFAGSTRNAAILAKVFLLKAAKHVAPKERAA